MTPLFKKLQLQDSPVIHVLDAPVSFEPELAALAALAEYEVRRAPVGKVGFALAFVKTVAEIESATRQLTRNSIEDPVLWMVYPKGTSRKYRCDFNRDTGWSALGQAGFEPVRQVAIDEDWSALRFRKVEYIRTMRRHPEGAISAAGRKKALEQREP